MNEREDSEKYQEKLVKIFQACDHGNKGYLTQAEFEYLCHQLHLQNQSKQLVHLIRITRNTAPAQVFFQDFKEALLSLLQEFGPEKLTKAKEQDYINARNTGVHSPEPERFHPESGSPSDDKGACMKSPFELMADNSSLVLTIGKHTSHIPSSPPSPLKRSHLEDEADNVPGGKQRKSQKGQEETFEAEGQLEKSAEHSYGLSEHSTMEQLIHICTKLGVGHHGYLTQLELGLVCQYIGVEQMEDEELEDLFARLDTDRDGYISFDEFVSGLSQHLTKPDFKTLNVIYFPRPPSGRRAWAHPPSMHLDQNSLFTYTNRERITLFSSLESSNTGFAKGGEIVQFWEKLHLHHGDEILMTMGFDPQSKVNLKDLSETLILEWMDQLKGDDFLGHIVSATFQHEVAYLRSSLDQTTDERNKLRADLTEALAHNAFLAGEVDERHAELENSYKAQLQLLDQQHQDQIYSLQTYLKKEKELYALQEVSLQQALEQVQHLEQQVSSLHEKLAESQREAAELCKELTQARERQADWEEQCHRLKKEMQQQGQLTGSRLHTSSPASGEEKQLAVEMAARLAAENKELKDRSDELMMQVEEMQRRLSAGLSHGSSGQIRRNSIPSRIPVRTQTSSVSSDASEMDDDELLSSSEGFYYNRRNLLATPEESDGTPSLSTELKHLQRLRRGEQQERERKEIEHAYRVEIADLEDKHREEKEHILKSFEREKAKMTEEFEAVLNQHLAEQQKDLQNVFALEKQDLLEQYESRKNYMELQHIQQMQQMQQALASRTKQDDKDAGNFGQSKMEELSDLNSQLDQKKVIIRGLTKEKADLEARLLAAESKMPSLLSKQVVQQKMEEETLQEQQTGTGGKVHSKLKRILKQGEAANEGTLQEDFLQLATEQTDEMQEQEQHNVDTVSPSTKNALDERALYAAVEHERMAFQHFYEAKILSLQQELETLRWERNVEQNAIHSTGIKKSAAQLRQQELQEVKGEFLSRQLQEWWEEELKKLMVKNKHLEEEVSHLKNSLLLERQRAGEAEMLKDRRRQFGANTEEFASKRKSSGDTPAGPGHMGQEAESRGVLGAGLMELEAITGLQVSLLDTQRHALSLQEALVERTQLSDRIIAEAERKRQKERATWAEEKREMHVQLKTTVDLYRSLVQQHHKLRQSSTKLGVIAKELYVENVDLRLGYSRWRANSALHSDGVASFRRGVRLGTVPCVACTAHNPTTTPVVQCNCCTHHTAGVF